MQVKKFEAKTMKEALEMVKTELGPEAIILSAKDNTGGFGLLGQNSVEITAAVSERTLQKRKLAMAKLQDSDRNKFQQSSAKSQKKFINSVIDRLTEQQAQKNRVLTRTQYVDIHDEEAFADEMMSLPQVQQQSAVPAIGRHRYQTQQLQSAGGGFESEPEYRQSQQSSARQRGLSVVSQPNNMTVPAPQQTLSPVPSGVSVEEHLKEVSALKNEISRLKSVVQDFQKIPQTFISVHPGAEKGVSYEFSFIYEKLRSVGVDDEGILTLIEEAKKSLTSEQQRNKNLIDAFVAKRILEKTTVTDDPYSSRVHIFAGASGHGKTTTLVKFASHLVVEKGKSVAILTADTMKVGAADQLKIYAQILNVPFSVVRNHSDWRYLMNELKDYDYLLLDFPALAMGSMEDINMAYKLLPPKEIERRVHLVVSATSKLSSVLELGRRYQSLDVKDAIFTGIDQAVNHGLLFNFQRQLRVPLHSFGIGSKIPEDFELASRERVLDLLFKLTKLSRKKS